MGIIQCKECGKEVSTSAKTCPHCGIKDPGTGWKEKVMGVVLLGLIVWTIYAWLSGDDDAFDVSTVDFSTIDLAWYKTISKSDRDSVVEKFISDKQWRQEDKPHYVNCLGDFVVNKVDTLKFTEVIGWCHGQSKNQPEIFTGHFNELDAPDLSSHAGVICKNIVRGQLSSPSTADFPFLGMNLYKMGKHRYVVKSYVNSKNDYGAVVRTDWHCDVQYKGSGDKHDNNSWDLVDIELR